MQHRQLTTIGAQEIKNTFEAWVRGQGFTFPNVYQFHHWLKNEGSIYLPMVTYAMFEEISAHFASNSLYSFSQTQFDDFKKKALGVYPVFNTGTSHQSVKSSTGSGNVHNRVHRFFRSESESSEPASKFREFASIKKIPKSQNHHTRKVLDHKEMSEITKRLEACVIKDTKVDVDELNDLVRDLRFGRNP